MEPKRIVWAALAACVIYMLPNAGAEDWPEWRGPRRDGIYRETGLLKQWPEGGPKQLWTAPLGEGYSCFAVADGRVFTLYQAEGEQRLIALDEKTGDKLWEKKTGVGYFNRFGNGPRSTPTVDGDRVHALDAMGNLLCAKAETGDIVWSQNILKEYGAPNLKWAVSMSPLVDGPRLIVNPGKSDGSSVVALDKMTGKVIWRALDDLAGYSSPKIREIDGVRQLLVFTGQAIVGLTPEEGRELWRHPWRTKHDVNAATPIVKDDTVFITSGYNHGCALLAIDKDDPTTPAKVVWESRGIRGQFSTPVLIDGHLYGFDEKILTCVEYATGRQIWKQRRHGETLFGKGSLLYADGLFYILTEQGATVMLARLSPEPDGLEVVSQVEGLVGPKCWTMPVIANGRLYLRDEAKMICLDVKAK